jgi:hypothetical protein
MPVALNDSVIVAEETQKGSNSLVHVTMFAAAGLFVCLLLMIYGLDLSPGLF